MKKKIILSAAIVGVLLACESKKGADSESQDKNTALITLTQSEINDGWQLLFDGTNTDQWKQFNKSTMSPAWIAKDGALTFDESLKNGTANDIVTRQEFENFELSLEWKIDSCGNSGIMFNVVDNGKYSAPYETGPEMQVLDNRCHPDAKIEKHRAGDLYDLIAANSAAVNAPPKWNQVRLISNKGDVEFWLNGSKVVEFKMHDDAWRQMIKNSKFKEYPDFGLSKKGRIALQDHGNNVWYRNIKIREIK
jgi:hypothetical protein